MAEHYGTAVIPARIKRPKNKANAEGTVGVISTWIIASLRNQQFFPLRELNGAIGEKLEEFNNKPFQKKPGSRKSAFLEEEKACCFLCLLPHTNLPPGRRHPYSMIITYSWTGTGIPCPTSTSGTRWMSV